VQINTLKGDSKSTDVDVQFPGRWLREEKQLRKVAIANKEANGQSKPSVKMASWSNGWAPGRMTSTLKDSSNAVLRM
jgi:hypothetical protein